MKQKNIGCCTFAIQSEAGGQKREATDTFGRRQAALVKYSLTIKTGGKRAGEGREGGDGVI